MRLHTLSGFRLILLVSLLPSSCGCRYTFEQSERAKYEDCIHVNSEEMYVAHYEHWHNHGLQVHFKYHQKLRA